MGCYGKVDKIMGWARMSKVDRGGVEMAEPTPTGDGV